MTPSRPLPRAHEAAANRASLRVAEAAPKNSAVALSSAPSSTDYITIYGGAAGQFLAACSSTS